MASPTAPNVPALKAPSLGTFSLPNSLNNLGGRLANLERTTGQAPAGSPAGAGITAANHNGGQNPLNSASNITLSFGPNIWDTAVGSFTGGFTGTAGQYTIPTAGVYSVTGTIRIVNNTPASTIDYGLGIWRYQGTSSMDSVSTTVVVPGSSDYGTLIFSLTTLFNCNAADHITYTVYPHVVNSPNDQAFLDRCTISKVG